MTARGPFEVPALIVGGGPVGLSTAVGLRHFGIDCMVVEKHPSTLNFPKGRGVTIRSVEIFRQWELEADVAEVSLPRGKSLFVFEGAALLADQFRRRELPVGPNPWSPTSGLICDQELLEKVLHRRAKDVGADVRFSVELVGLTQDDDSVTADLRSKGERFSVRAQYLIAADGGRSPTRERRGIGRSGPGALGNTISILFEADLESRMKHRQSGAYLVQRPRAGCTFGAVDNKRRWLLLVPFDPDNEPTESFTEERCLELAQAGVGDDEIELRYMGQRVWQPTALVADKFQDGRILLAGDAAHVTTPVGGLGMNCGIADTQNLAWKLAGVLDGWARPGLLESYGAERRPHAVACAEASLGAAMPPNPIAGLVLGQVYESAIIIDDHTDAPSVRDPVGEYVPVARPGHRAPHVWLDDGRSTLDLFGRAFVAVTDAEGAQALDLLSDGAGVSGIPLEVHAVNPPAWHELYGVGPGGIALVRPDGYVAWRSVGSRRDPTDFTTALRTAAGAPGTSPRAPTQVGRTDTSTC